MSHSISFLRTDKAIMHAFIELLTQTSHINFSYAP